MRATALFIALLSCSAAVAADFDRLVVGVTPDTVAVRTTTGEVVVFTATDDVKAGRIEVPTYKLLHKELIVGQTITVRSRDVKKVHYGVGYRLLAPPK